MGPEDTDAAGPGSVDRDSPGPLAELPLLPFVYLAWADGALSPEEIETIRLRMERLSWLGPEATRRIRGWLDPDTPPSPTRLLELRERLREAAGPDAGTAAPGEGALVRLGLDLLEAEARSGLGAWGSPEGREALAALEDDLAIPPEEAARLLLDEAPAAADSSPAIPPLPGALQAPIDRGALTHVLEPDRSELRDDLMELLARETFSFGPEVPRVEYRERVLGALRILAANGYGSLAYPTEFGGRGRPDLAVRALETLAYGDLSVMVKYGVQFGLFGGSILQLGTARHHEAWLRAAGTLELPGSYAMTERGHGSNVQEIETVARYLPDEDRFEVHSPTPSAAKDWIGNAALHGRLATVFAQLEVDGMRHGVHALLVPIRDDDGRVMPGVTIEDCGPKEGLNGVDNGRITFDRVRVPREALLDRFGSVDATGVYRSPIPSAGRRFFTMLGTLVGGRVSIAAASVSVSKTALTIAVRYAGARRQFGPTGGEERRLIDHRAHQRLLLPKLAATYALHFATRELTRRYAFLQRHTPKVTAAPATEALDRERRELEALAAAVKATASWHAMDTLQAGREACGGRGYDALNRFGRMKADADVFTTFEGANPVLLQLTAKALLSRYRDELGDLRLGGWVRFLAEQARTRVLELNPVVVRRTDEAHLLDAEFHREALRYREDRLLASAARRLRAALDEGVDSFDAINRVQDHLLTLARAHAERFTWEQAHAAALGAEDDPTVAVLERLSALYALSRIEEDRAWFLESGYMEPAKTRAIRRVVNRLCGELAVVAEDLVDAFEIPDAVLAVPRDLSRDLAGG